MAAILACPALAPRTATHLSYKEMIVQALTELREPAGSTRHAIGMYIANHFICNTAKHDELLNAQLRCLESEGVIRTDGSLCNFTSILRVKPKVEPIEEGAGVKPEGGPIEDRAEAEAVQPVGGTGAVQSGIGSSSLQLGGASSTQKRRRGRPRKEKPSEIEPAEIGVAELVEKRGRGRPRKERPSTERSAETGNGTSMGIKRGRGRPRKERPSTAKCAETGPAEIGVAELVEKTGRGSPRKERPSTERSAETGNGMSMGINRGRGRPRKERPSTAKFAETGPAEIGVAELVEKRGRGSPSKERPSTERSAETGNGTSMGIKRGRGGPRKESPSTAKSAETGNGPSMGIKRGRGRPRKEKTAEAGPVEAGAEAEPSQADVDKDFKDIKAIMEQVVQCGALEGSDGYYIATKLFCALENRLFFYAMETSEGRLNWLKRNFMDWPRKEKRVEAGAEAEPSQADVDKDFKDIKAIMEQVVQCGAPEGSDGYYIATKLFGTLENRHFFYAMETSEGRLNWLERNFKDWKSTRAILCCAFKMVMPILV